MRFDSEVRELFNKKSAGNPNSLVNFIIDSQVTIQGIGLDPDDVITFEMFYMGNGTMPEACGCIILPGELPEVMGAATLLCNDCDHDGNKIPVRLTAANPVVVLDSPQGVIIRAVYDGPGLSESRVWLTTNTSLANLTPELRGCHTDCYPYFATLPLDCAGKNCAGKGFRPGENPPDATAELTDCEGNVVAYLYPRAREGATTPIQDCQGNIAGYAVDTGHPECPIPISIECEDWDWEPTGEIRCMPDQITAYHRETNRCGHFRWVLGPPQRWIDTGDTRCHNRLGQVKQINECGQIRWVDTETHCGYFATYRLPCEGLGYRPGHQPPDATEVLEDCDGNVLAYIYPEPQEGAMTPVLVGCGCNEALIGFAVDAVHADCSTSYRLERTFNAYASALADKLDEIKGAINTCNKG